MKKVLPFLVIPLLTAPLWAKPPKPPKKPSQVPEKYQFVRTLDVELGGLVAGQNHAGAQFLRVETRYRDPDVDAFVGLMMTISRFNEDLRLGDPDDPTVSSLVANWGGCMGIVRGAHLWAVDLMGVSLGRRVAFGPALVGEHTLGKRFKIFHRTAADLFGGDTILDSDQGLLWTPWKNVGFTAGYRIFASQHMNRNGPRASILLHFQSPKIPFLFPSIG